MRNRLLVALAGLILAVTAGCGSSSQPGSISGSSASAVAPVSSAPVSTNKDDYPVFPDADAGADPSVSAEQGGKGFTGKGWETNTDFDLLGDPHAIKGGTFHDHIPDFPGTLRMLGPEANTFFNFTVVALAYESLLGVHPTTLDYIPNLATHWQISPDKMTYRFRINPNARFSDGTPVTADDVVATFDLMLDKTAQAPMEQITFQKLDEPVAESKYIVRVHAKELNWRNFLYFSGMAIYPAHILKTLNGDAYLKTYNFKLLPGSGPYTIEEADIHKGQSIAVRRRKDYWGEKARANVGLNNFDQLQFAVVRDENLAFEQFKKGQLDAYPIARPKQWVEELNFDNVQRGLIQKRKVYNGNPQGISGFAFNTRVAPFSDIRVRKALAMLLDRPEIIQKIMYNELEPLNSYFAASPYENPDDPKTPYDPQAALKLLADAGWSGHDAQGRLVKNGAPLEIEVLYERQISEPQLTVYQEDLRKVGIAVNLRLVTPETLFQLISDRKFQAAYLAWGGMLFPNPETSFASTLADQNSTNNITGFKNRRADQIFKDYDKTFDQPARVREMRELDGLLANDYQYALNWYDPSVRFAYWNIFGMPPGELFRDSDYSSIYQLWWSDPQKYAQVQKAKSDSSIKMEVGPSDDRYWIDYEKKAAQPHS